MSKKSVDIMVDLETMGVNSDAAIVSIGAVAFTDKVEDSFYTVIDLQTALDAGASVSASTIYWWLTQSQEARAAIYQQKDHVSILHALTKFSNFCAKYNILGVWGNGANFDNTLLENAYRSQGLTKPWPYWADRCFRTVKSLNPPLSDDELPRVNIAHHALYDATWQAEYLIALRYGGSI